MDQLSRREPITDGRTGVLTEGRSRHGCQIAWSKSPSSSIQYSVQMKSYLYADLYVNRSSVFHCRLESPLLDCLDRLRIESIS